jgi:prepilin peptidase CpaA
MVSPAVWVTAALLVVAAGFDLRSREIPNTLPLALLVWAVAARALGLQPADWLGLLAGLGLGFALGAGLFALGAMGGGDAKLLAALGAVLGPRAFGIVLIYIALIGGVLALAARMRRQSEVVYGPAIALGYVAAVVVALLVGRG